ncbi:DciA family protein [Microbacterium sp. M3]|uniref:DciA family protein n=1 Tax=Microbacterium arthrosphaerae TaxID=792652 RepID=A0ABU4H4Y2_9MICO|nr:MULTISPECIES: DciA family protein [Microbacterium]MDW4574383.1 DciA family protein [Microbacterium arthrosphaerae]MDW7608238.1 DciA family protein [Microbacterium sp. M3]
MPEAPPPGDAASVPPRSVPNAPGAPLDRTAVPETIATYLRLRGLEPSARSYRKRRRRTVDDENVPFAAGRDPRGVGDVLADLTREAGWDAQLAREDVVRAWAEVAGDDTAQHTRPVAFTEGTLTVQADSTAWAKQLQLMRAHILSEIVRKFPEAGVDAVRFIGPDVPSWKWGPRTIPGRGPRDTYG